MIVLDTLPSPALKSPARRTRSQSARTSWPHCGVTTSMRVIPDSIPNVIKPAQTVDVLHETGQMTLVLVNVQRVIARSLTTKSLTELAAQRTAPGSLDCTVASGKPIIHLNHKPTLR